MLLSYVMTGRKNLEIAVQVKTLCVEVKIVKDVG